MIDFGYVVSAIVPVILLAIFKDNLEPVWRLSLGLGIVPPLSVLYCKSFIMQKNQLTHTLTFFFF